MSGGSYDYLFCHVDDAYALLLRRQELERMTLRLTKLRAMPPVRQCTKVLRLLNQFEAQTKYFSTAIADAAVPLQGVFKAVEYVDSRDWAQEKIAEAIAEFRPKGNR